MMTVDAALSSREYGSLAGRSGLTEWQVRSQFAFFVAAHVNVIASKGAS
jgi:hypothetical protein